MGDVTGLSGEPRVRKRLLTATDSISAAGASNEIDISACATVLYDSEESAHPIEHLLDGRSGKGATHWASGRDNTVEKIVINFDQPVHIRRLMLEAEEPHAERTQQVTVEFSSDGGNSYQRGFVQEYTFSPHGATYQREDLSVALPRP